MAAIEKASVIAALMFYAAASCCYFTGLKTNKTLRPALLLAAGGLAANLIALINRSVASGRLPLATGYEFLLCFTLITAFLYLVYEIRSKMKNAGGPVMLIAALLLAVIVIFMPEQFYVVTPLMPALKSPWLMAHVSTAVIAYGGFAFAAGLAVMQLRQKGLPDTENAIYKITAAGFAMLSLSIVLGAIWAEQAWGSYWSWDPKEIWALITWIIYAIYLHLHRQRLLSGSGACYIVIAGFILVLFTFFGVNYLMSGLHSYG